MDLSRKKPIIGRRPHEVAIVALFAFVSLPGLASVSSRASAMTQMQEFAVLTGEQIGQASRHCGFAVNHERYRALLAASHMTQQQATSAQRSPALQTDIGISAASYDLDPKGACAVAWGALGTPGPGYLLP